MKRELRRITIALFAGACFLLITCSAGFSQAYRLAYPPRPDMPDSYTGISVDLTPRDGFESCSLSFTRNGPVYYVINGIVNPPFMQGGELQGSVHVDPYSPFFPKDGDSAKAYVECQYTITYSSPLSPLTPLKGPLGGATGVERFEKQQWDCYGHPDAPCKAGHTQPSRHVLLEEKGRVKFDFIVFAAALKNCPEVSRTGQKQYNPATQVCCCKRLPKDIGKQSHHIASHNNTTETPNFQKILDEINKKIDPKKVTLTLEQPWNLMDISTEFHCSCSHPQTYHDFVLKGMKKARDAALKKGVKDPEAVFKAQFKSLISDPLSKNFSMLCRGDD